MADDIDELLREVEEKFLPENGAKSNHQQVSPRRIEPMKHSARALSDLASHELEDDISDLLEDCMLSVNKKSKHPSPRRSISAKELYSTIQKEKCFPIYLSGVLENQGNNNIPRVCSHLRCTNCDFRVGQFNHFKWRPGTDYLFLRNHMPEFDRVRVKLGAAKMCRAYACQCKFVTVKDLINLEKLGPDFNKWVCGGH